ncbi:MAG: S8 family serine peptidase [Pyrinomonadaceae bacterium]
MSNQVIVSDFDGLSAEAVAAEYLAFAEVEYAEPSFTISLDPSEDLNFDAVLNEKFDDLEQFDEGATPNDPMFADQWALENRGDRNGKAKADISAVRAWSKTKGTRKVVVAVLDSGVDYTHPDLAANIWLRPANIPAYNDEQLGKIDDVYGFNAIDHSGDPMDDNGHGTHCAGIIGAEGGNDIGITGVNWEVEIMPLKFMSAGGFGTTKDAIQAINYVIDRKRAGVNVRIISASWGSRMKSKALEDVIRKAGDEGILFVAASGNSSADADRAPHYPSGYNLPNVTSVAALNRRDELASFSNYGTKSVHVAAPGAEILSTWLDGGYEEQLRHIHGNAGCFGHRGAGAFSRA